MRPCSSVVVLSVRSPITAFEIVSLPLNSAYQEYLEKKKKTNPTQSHCSACWSVCAITSHSFAANGQLQKI